MLENKRIGTAWRHPPGPDVSRSDTPSSMDIRQMPLRRRLPRGNIGVMSDISCIFAADGPLARGVPGYRPRPQQIEMAQRIAAAIKGNRILVEIGRAHV